MAIVTFLSDFGTSDHYVAAVKARILKENPAINIIDITHNLTVGDIGHAAHVLGEVFRDFPSGTVHLIGVSNSATYRNRCVAMKVDSHFFVGEDSGIYSLLTTSAPYAIVDLTSINKAPSVFWCKDVMAAAAAKLASGKDIQELGPRIDDLQRFTLSLAKATKQQIVGNIVHIDHYGNLVTNIMKKDFDAIIKLNGDCGFEVNFRREKIKSMNTYFSEVSSGECFVLFNATNRLIIGIRQGRGSELLGLTLNDQVFIDFLI